MLLLFLCFTLFFLTTSSQIIHITSPLQPPIPPLSPPPPPKTPLKPTAFVVVVVVTLIFSITFLLLLYVKHCNRTQQFNNINRAGTGSAFGSRKDSGIDRMLIESLPVFRFGSLTGQKEGLECAVCLNKFESVEYLKLLPKCNHAFHVHCVDIWLEAHSTCPLCRYRVQPEDILLIHHHSTGGGGGGGVCNGNYNLQHLDRNQDQEDEEIGILRRVSGRHSSAGERSRSSRQTVVEKSDLNRISLDSSRSLGLLKKKKMEEDRSGGTGSRKDGLLVTAEEAIDSFERRFSHRIVVSGGDDKWSDGNQTDLLYLRSEMILSDSRRFSGV